MKVIHAVFGGNGGVINLQPVGASFVSIGPLPILPAPALTLPLPGGGARVLIDGSIGSYWNSSGAVGDITSLAILLMHELGHVYDLLSGSGGSQIQLDDGIRSSQSVANTARVIKDCFR